ncbi:Fpg/Nei family DNA glycosylase [Streptomyces sp. 6N223]|uniref:Fpg/Nei family DNA glycosylase n=1 Tax=Streptomyces sp. 6N223 TaxID=3457412 RepID=UPI003FD65D47
MPELPDVEGYRRVLASHGKGHRIERVEVADAGVLRGVTARRLARDLGGRRFGEPERRGKWLLGTTRDGGPTLLMHFGMTGNLVCDPPDAPPQPHDRVTFALDDGHLLRFRDQRKLQGIWLAASEADVERVIGDQGPDALSMGRGQLAQALSGRRGRIKGTLVDQSVVAGLGNLLSDEILWQARIHPARQTARLSKDDQRRLDTTMHRVLRDSVKAGHVPTRRSWLTGRRYDDDPHCPRCDGPLSTTRAAGRTTAFCPACQPEDGRG